MTSEGLFEVPAWGCQEGTSTNTCTIDGFLATLLCAKWKDRFFLGRLIGDDLFTNACRDFVGGKDTISERKRSFIEALYPTGDEGDYDLWGDEQSMIHEKAKRQSEIVVTASCVDCYQELIETRDSFIVRPFEGETLVEAIHATIAAPARGFCDDEKECTEKKEVSVKVSETTWMLPIDLSQCNVNPAHIGKLPPLITVGGVVFQLGGVTIYINSKDRADRKKSGGHYSCVMWHDMKWLYYDGLAAPKLQTIRNLDSINRFKENALFTCKCAYYFRASD